MTVYAECNSCNATGLYRGMAEPKGTAVVCLRCDGTGKREIEYKPFTTLRTRTDVNAVYRSTGTSILSCGPGGRPITYQEFLEGKRP